MTTWNTQTGFPVYAGTACGTTTVQNTADDGTNVVFFDNDEYDLDVERGSTVLGAAFSYFGKCGSTNWEITDIDIVFRRDGDPNNMGGDVDWNYGPGNPTSEQTDFESVALHELGHNHQLAHVIDGEAVMNWQILTGSVGRVLGTNDDIAGANYVMDISTNYNPPLVLCGGDYNSPRQATAYSAANSCGGASLPLQLLSFSGQQQEKVNILEWQTANEHHFSHFLLEKSMDGVHFQFLDKIMSRQGQYRALDNAPQKGINYYRLRQVDRDGREEISEVIQVSFLSTETKFSIFPNPNESGLLQIQMPQIAESQVEIFAVDGQLMLNQTIPVNAAEINISNLAKGIYFVKIKQAGASYIERLIVQ